MDGKERSEIPRRRHALVAGGAGFLGAHLCRRLIVDGYDVVALDNLATGSLGNLREPLRDGHLRFLHQDVVQPCEMPVELVFNLACCASPIHYQAHPVQTLQTCLTGALNMLKLAHRHGARIFQASTSEVYGEPETHPQIESYRGAVSITGPRACYDEGKRCAETLFMDYRRQHGLRIKIARIFNTYGPRMAIDDGRVISNFLVQALRGDAITIYGEGRQTRAFCYVDDMIDAFVRLMETPDGVTGPVNLGNPEEMDMRTLASHAIEAAAAYTGVRAPIVHAPLPSDDPTRRCPDIGLARELLRWAPVTPLAAGLARTTAYFAKLLGIARRSPMLSTAEGVSTL